ncbi:MAG: internalin, putative, partial [uncultured Solirubrobacteraceae bacterium]
ARRLPLSRRLPAPAPPAPRRLPPRRAGHGPRPGPRSGHLRAGAVRRDELHLGDHLLLGRGALRVLLLHGRRPVRLLRLARHGGGPRRGIAHLRRPRPGAGGRDPRRGPGLLGRRPHRALRHHHRRPVRAHAGGPGDVHLRVLGRRLQPLPVRARRGVVPVQDADGGGDPAGHAHAVRARRRRGGQRRRARQPDLDRPGALPAAPRARAVRPLRARRHARGAVHVLRRGRRALRVLRRQRPGLRVHHRHAGRRPRRRPPHLRRPRHRRGRGGRGRHPPRVDRRHRRPERDHRAPSRPAAGRHEGAAGDVRLRLGRRHRHARLLARPRGVRRLHVGADVPRRSRRPHAHGPRDRSRGQHRHRHGRVVRRRRGARRHLRGQARADHELPGGRVPPALGDGLHSLVQARRPRPHGRLRAVRGPPALRRPRVGRLHPRGGGRRRSREPRHGQLLLAGGPRRPDRRLHRHPARGHHRAGRRAGVRRQRGRRHPALLARRRRVHAVLRGGRGAEHGARRAHLRRAGDRPGRQHGPGGPRGVDGVVRRGLRLGPGRRGHRPARDLHLPRAGRDRRPGVGRGRGRGVRRRHGRERPADVRPARLLHGAPAGHARLGRRPGGRDRGRRRAHAAHHGPARHRRAGRQGPRRLVRVGAPGARGGPGGPADLHVLRSRRDHRHLGVGPRRGRAVRRRHGPVGRPRLPGRHARRGAAGDRRGRPRGHVVRHGGRRARARDAQAPDGHARAQGPDAPGAVPDRPHRRHRRRRADPPADPRRQGAAQHHRGRALQRARVPVQARPPHRRGQGPDRPHPPPGGPDPAGGHRPGGPGPRLGADRQVHAGVLPRRRGAQADGRVRVGHAPGEGGLPGM